MPVIAHNLSLLGLTADAKLLCLGARPPPAEWTAEARSLKLEHVSPETLVHQEICRRTPLGQEAEQARQRGQSVADRTLFAILGKWFWTRKPDAGFLLQGFPATLLHARVFDEWLEANDEALSGVVAPDRAREGDGHHRTMIPIKDREAIAHMREACTIAATVLQRLKAQVQPGISTQDLEEAGHQMIAEYGATSACYGYQLGNRRYPAHTCISLNEEVVHGIPTLRRILREGDIVSLDIVIRYHRCGRLDRPRGRTFIASHRGSAEGRYPAGRGRQPDRRHLQRDPAIRRECRFQCGA
jgi:hypothetical protein